MSFWPLQTIIYGLLSFPFERGNASSRLSSYFVAKSLAEAPLRLILPAMFLIIAHCRIFTVPFKSSSQSTMFGICDRHSIVSIGHNRHSL